MIKRRLSQVLGAIEKGYGVDTFEGGFPVQQVMMTPDTPDANGVHAAVTLTTAEQDINTGITNPDCYRTLRLTGNQSSVSGTVSILGRDWAGRTFREDILVTGTVAVNTLHPFKEVDTITYPVKVSDSETIVVGKGDNLGLYRPLFEEDTANLLLVELENHTGDTVLASSAVYGTFKPTTTMDNSHSYFVHYLTDVF